MDCFNSVIINNTVVNNIRVGIYAKGDNITFTGNNTSQNCIGLLQDGNNTIITGNTLNGNRLIGDGFDGTNGTVRNNHIVANMIEGIIIDELMRLLQEILSVRLSVAISICVMMMYP